MGEKNIYSKNLTLNWAKFNKFTVFKWTKIINLNLDNDMICINKYLLSDIVTGNDLSNE